MPIRILTIRGRAGELPYAIMSLRSPPVVYKNLVITWGNPNEGTSSFGAYGDIRAWDVRTGKLVWMFHTVPRPGEPGNDTWPADGCPFWISRPPFSRFTRWRIDACW